MGTFIVTSHGRSGTAWLAKLANTSPTWFVKHEPLPPHKENYAAANARFASARTMQVNYGEVNSCLRHFAGDIEVDTKMVIVREPGEIILSWANRHTPPGTTAGMMMALTQFQSDFQALDDLAEAGAEVISFKRMVTEPWYTQAILKRLGIEDVKVFSADCQQKVNENRTKRYETLEDIGASWHSTIRDMFSWYRRKYLGEDQ